MPVLVLIDFWGMHKVPANHGDDHEHKWLLPVLIYALSASALFLTIVLSIGATLDMSERGSESVACGISSGSLECAQWRATIASERSASWAKLSAITGVTGSVGLLITIVISQLALKRAREANDTARAHGEAQLRAYFTLTNAQYALPDIGRGAAFSIRLINNGQTPAKRFRHSVRAFVDAPDASFVAISNDELSVRPFAQVGPGQAIPINGRAFEIETQDVEEVMTGRKRLYIVGALEFETVHNRRYRLNFGRRGKNPMIEGSKEEDGHPVYFTSSWEWEELEQA